MSASRVAAEGLRCRGWEQEAALRMLENNLHPDVAENPAELVVYGGIGKAARDHRALEAIMRELIDLHGDETLLVQSGKPVAVVQTHAFAPRVLIANSNLVGEWATWHEFRRLDALGLFMYGQMTAGSWIYIGTQGILQGTYETFAAVARKRFGGTLAGRLVVTAGLGGMGGAQPLAITMLDGCALCVEIDRRRIERRIATGYLDDVAVDLDDALRRLDAARARVRPLSIGLLGNAAQVLPELARRGVAVDVATDQTSAHDPLNGYVPPGLTLEQAAALRTGDPEEYLRRAGEGARLHVGALRALAAAGAEVFDYGNALRGLAAHHGDTDAFAYPGFVPAYLRDQFCEGRGPFRWVALSGDPADIAATDAAILELFGDQEHVARWIRLASEKVAFQGLPARICWLGYGERDRAALRFNEMVASGELAAPIVIGRDHLDAGSVASPERETEAMRDGSDAVADWPLLNALMNTACGASWVSIHQGGGVGMGKSIHAGQVCVADGSEAAATRLERVMRADPGLGVARHADAGYPLARRTAQERGVRIPMDAWTDLVLSGADQVLVPREAGLPHLRRPGAESLTTEPGSVAVADGRIAALEDDPGAATRIDASGCSVVPGFVDCHTHLPFAGWRALEYAGKVAGESYAAIARAGGGIGASVRSLADTADDDVLAQSAAVAAEMLATGTTCLELKSGYGGGLAGERRQLLLARSLGDEVAQDTSITALVAHTAPEGFTADAWLDELAGALDGLLDATGASALDIFVEDVAFTNAHLERLGALAHDHGLALRAHVEQLASHGSVPVALAAGARSVDHLSCLPDNHVGLLAAAPCAAVLLPGAELLNDERTAPARALADAGAICVLATDCNPGTSPIASLPLIVGLAVRRYRWTVLEALAAVTLNAAWVLGRDRELGSIEAGKRADLLLLDGPIEHLPYRLGRSPVAAVVLGGEAVHVRPDAAWRVEGVPVP